MTRVKSDEIKIKRQVRYRDIARSDKKVDEKSEMVGVSKKG